MVLLMIALLAGFSCMAFILQVYKEDLMNFIDDCFAEDGQS